jgi:hypothetical protein
MAEKQLPNLRVLRSIRIRGKHVGKGTVIAKSAFDNRGDWDDLCKMSPPKLEETDDKISTSGKATKAEMPV